MTSDSRRKPSTQKASHSVGSWTLPVVLGTSFGLLILLNQAVGDHYQALKRAQQASRTRIALLRDTLSEAKDIVSFVVNQHSSAEQRERFDLQQFGQFFLKSNDKFMALQLSPAGILSDQYPQSSGPQIGINLLEKVGESGLSAYSIEKNEAVFRGPFELIQGGEGLVLRGPVFDEVTGDFWGFVGILVDWVSLRTVDSQLSGLDFDYELIGAPSQALSPLASKRQTLSSLHRNAVVYDVKLLDGRLVLATSWQRPWVQSWPWYLAGFLVAGLAAGCVTRTVQRSFWGQGINGFQYRLLFEQSSDALLVLDGLRIELANSAAISLFGVDSSAGLIGESLSRFSPSKQSDGSPSLERIQAIITGLNREKICTFEFTFVRKDDGSEWRGEVVLRSIHLGSKQRISMRISDLTALKTVENRERGMAVKYQAVFEQSADAILLLDQNGCFFEANQASSHIFGVTSPEELIGHPPTDFAPEFQPGGMPSLELADGVFQRCVENDGLEFEFLHQRPQTGELWWAEVNLRPLQVESEDVFIARVRDVSEVKRYQERLSDLAYVDELTHLPNRLSAYEWLSQQIRDENWKNLVLVAFDLDGFQKINELYGHQVGDQVLLAFCQWLNDQPLLDGWRARLASDSFVVCLHQSHAVDWLEELKTLLKELDLSLYMKQDFSLYVTASAGIVLVDSRHVPAPNAWLEQLNTALVKASDSGRSGCVLYDEVLRRNLQSLQDLEQALHFALRDPDQAFSLMYQPKVDREGRCLGAEALLRLTGPKGQFIPPDRFIPLAESSGQIHEIGTWVIHAAFRQYQEWLQSGCQPGTLAINVSATQFERSPGGESVVEILKKAVRTYGIDPTWIELEITETAAFSDFGEPLRMLEDLSSFGFRLAIDDFGTGFAALNHIARAPVNAIKLDKIFVDGLPDNERDQVIVSSACRLAQGLGLDLVAEGVETVEQRDHLLRLGCSMYQGYLFDKPLTPALYQERYLQR